VAGIPSCRPHDDRHSAIEISGREETSFRIFAPKTFDRQFVAREHLHRSLKIQPSLGQRPVTLCWIERDAHRFLLLQK